MGIVNGNASKRVFALFWAIVFLLNTAGDGFGAHACLYHDAPGSGHAAQHESAHDHSEPADEGAHELPFACLFACQASAGTALALEPTVSAGFTTLDAVPVAFDRPESLLRRNLPHFLPYANAPPSLG